MSSLGEIGSPYARGSVAPEFRTITWPSGRTQAATVWLWLTPTPQPLGTGAWRLPSASCTSTYGVPLSAVCQRWVPSESTVNEEIGYFVATSIVLPSSWWSTLPSRYSMCGALPVGRSDTSMTPGAGWLPSSVAVSVGDWVGTWVTGGSGSGLPLVWLARATVGTIKATAAATPATAVAVRRRRIERALPWTSARCRSAPSISWARSSSSRDSVRVRSSWSFI